MNITFTLIGQTIAFFVFVAFCWKFIWPFLIAAMRERQQTIADGLEAAAKAQRDLEHAEARAQEIVNEARNEARGIVDDARSQASQMIDNARTDAESERERILKAAQADVAQEVNRAKESLRAEVADLAVLGAERILEASIDRERHDALLERVAAEL
ncbi:MAG: F0F1 ATP synthase subunit B [Gammaproteobacteria bacterium]|nr:F0F1 ATP synthase subunit B [Gammaproteobacteria bacterium]